MKRVLAIVACSALLTLSACGGSSGGGGGYTPDLSCAPSTLLTPTVDLNTATLGAWTLTLTKTSTTCAYPPTSITCILDMVVTGNDVATSGTCTSVAATPITITLDGIAGKVSANTLYFGAQMTGGAGTYSETDTVPCTSVDFPSNFTSDTFNVTVSVAWSDSGESGTCSTTFSGIFN